MNDNEYFFDQLPDNVAIKTDIWGPPTWFFLHSMTFAYPKIIDPNNLEHIKIKNGMYNFLQNLSYVLPCKICRESYLNNINTDELNINKYLDSRANLVYFMYKLHEKVNDKLGIPNCDRPNFNEVVTFYKQFIASSSIPTNDKQRIKNLLRKCNKTNNKFKKYYHNTNNKYLIIILLIIIIILIFMLLKKNKFFLSRTR